MSDEHLTSLPDGVKLPFEANSHGITPYFKVITPLNVAQSEEQGKPVYGSPMEVVELRLAGDRNYAPVVPADSMYRKFGTRVVTYAERFADQYRAFMTGGNQVAGGTALEALQDYGITPAQLSVCRALKIYSIEALHELDGHNAKALGMNYNALKSMARRWMEDKSKRDVTKAGSAIEAMQAEIERLKALIPAEQTPPEKVDELLAAADAEASAANDRFDAMDKEELKQFIAAKTGTRPQGNPNEDTLRSMARDVA